MTEKSSGKETEGKHATGNNRGDRGIADAASAK